MFAFTPKFLKCVKSQQKQSRRQQLSGWFVETSKDAGWIVWHGTGRGCVGLQDQYFVRVACRNYFFLVEDVGVGDRYPYPLTHEIHIWRDQPDKIPRRVEICREQRDLATPLLKPETIAQDLSEAISLTLRFDAPLQMLQTSDEPRLKAKPEELALYWSHQINCAYHPILKAALGSQGISERTYWKLRSYFLENYPP